MTIDPLLRVAILWRRDLSRVKYEWLESEWSPDSGHEGAAASVNSSHDSLRTTLQRLLTSNEVLTLETELGKLSDEHVQSLFVRVADKGGILFSAVVRFHIWALSDILLQPVQQGFHGQPDWSDF